MRNIAIEILKQFQKTNNNSLFMAEMSHHFDKNNLSEWHLEGDVWTHTMLAYNNFLTRVSLFKNERVLVGCTIAILCHDIGKTITKEQKIKKIKLESKDKKEEVLIPKYGFNGHDNAGTQMCIDFIYDLQENGFFDDKEYSLQDIMEDVLPVVSNHMFYYNWDIEKIKSACSSKYQYKIWAELAISDFYGSISEDLDTETESKFYAMQKSAGVCFIESTKYEFAIKTIDDNIIKEQKIFVPHDIMLVCGLPGTGKDYVFKDLGYGIISYDNERLDIYTKENPDDDSLNQHDLYMKAWNWCNDNKINLNNLLLKRAKKFFDAGKKIAILNVNQSRKRRRKLRNIFKGKTISCCWIGAKHDNIVARDEKRKSTGCKSVGRKVILSMSKRIQYPTIQEGFECVNYIDNNKKT